MILIVAVKGRVSISVDNNDNEKTEPPKESLDYSITSAFIDTEAPDQLRIYFHIQIYGTSVINGNPLKTSKIYDTSIQTKRNKWSMLLFYRGDSLFYFEVQATSQQPN